MAQVGRNEKGHFTSENKFAEVNRKFKTKKKLQAAIDEYFDTGATVRTVVTGVVPYQKTIEIQVTTITGLAFFLGFASRQSLYDYEKDGRFSYIIKRARLKIEQNYEEMLQVGSGQAAGQIFALKNMGWTDKTEIAHGGVKGGAPIMINLGNGIEPERE